MLKIYKIKKDTMARLFWRLHWKHQTQSTPYFNAFNANPKHETAILVYLNIYICCNARPADENEDNWTATMKCGFSVLVIKLRHQVLKLHYWPWTGKYITIRKYIKESDQFYIVDVKITMKLQLQHSAMVSIFSFLKLFSIWLNSGSFSLGKWNKFLLPEKKIYIHLNWQIHTF